MTGWRRFLRLGIGVALAVTAYFVVPVEVNAEDVAMRLVVSVLIVSVLTAGVIWQVVRHLEHPQMRVDGLVFAVVLAVLAFALGFYRLEMANPGEIYGLNTRLDSLYFTVSTLLTVGFGDIHAQGQTARAMVLVAMIFNVLVVATAVTTLSNAVRRRAQERVEERRQNPAADHPPARTRRTHRNPR
ncbi:potassium channel family protein [Nocardioides sp.]|uniref:potassium channel family protein n=1 Tax=Nocardioides sp. TaxID=35761 RepID=UPI0037842C3F